MHSSTQLYTIQVPQCTRVLMRALLPRAVPCSAPCTHLLEWDPMPNPAGKSCNDPGSLSAGSRSAHSAPSRLSTLRPPSPLSALRSPPPLYRCRPPSHRTAEPRLFLVSSASLVASRRCPFLRLLDSPTCPCAAVLSLSTPEPGSSDFFFCFFFFFFAVCCFSPPGD